MFSKRGLPGLEASAVVKKTADENILYWWFFICSLSCWKAWMTSSWKTGTTTFFLDTLLVVVVVQWQFFVQEFGQSVNCFRRLHADDKGRRRVRPFYMVMRGQNTQAHTYTHTPHTNVILGPTTQPNIHTDIDTGSQFHSFSFSSSSKTYRGTHRHTFIQRTSLLTTKLSSPVFPALDTKMPELCEKASLSGLRWKVALSASPQSM